MRIRSTKPESWLPIPGFEGYYEASTCGQVRNSRNGRILRPFAGDARGHVKVSLSTGGHVRNTYIHRAVAITHIGPQTEGLEVCHIDGNPANNSSENLKWGTRSENVFDSIRHGTYRNANGEKTRCPKRHEYTEVNTYRDPRGGRRCRTCIRMAKAAA